MRAHILHLTRMIAGALGLGCRGMMQAGMWGAAMPGGSLQDKASEAVQSAQALGKRLALLRSCWASQCDTTLRRERMHVHARAHARTYTHTTSCSSLSASSSTE
eukprot:3261167-Rhodomonas_salina.4